MRKFLLLTLSLILVISCSKFDDSSIWEELKKHEERIEKLETFCNQMNTNISSLQTIVTALQNSDYVTNIAPIMEGSKEIGYSITFAKSGSITIYHGKDGQNGSDGKDGVTPKIGVKKDSDNVYYWTINGEWLLDDSGNKVPASGKDGKDGEDGEDGEDGTNGSNGTNGTNGKDGITPQLRIKDGYWQVSYDGKNWTTLDKATGNDGKDAGVVVTHDKNNVYFKFADGSVVTISKNGGNPAVPPQNTYEIPSAGDQITVNVKANVDYVVHINCNWIRPAGSKASQSYTFVVDPNYTHSERVGIIRFEEKNGSSFETITIKQAQRDAIIFSEYEYNLSSDAQSLAIDVQANVEFIVEIPEAAQDWISYIGTKALSDKKLVFQIKANTTQTDRESFIYLTKKGDVKFQNKVKIKQSKPEEDTPDNNVLENLQNGGTFNW